MLAVLDLAGPAAVLSVVYVGTKMVLTQLLRFSALPVFKAPVLLQ